jgi:hypothetical protein
MNFQEMTKNDIKKYAESIGVQLDLKYKKDELIEQLKQHLIFCAECGQEIAKTDKFCFSCGTEVGKKATSSAVANTTTPVETSESVVTEYGKNVFSKLLDGDYGLAKTYWLFGVLVNVGFNILFKVVESTASYPRQALAQILILTSISVAYGIVVIIGTWRASSKYQGPKFWAVLAKIMVVIGIVGLVVALLSIGVIFNEYTTQ